jgi:shikimate dehydrogenase
MKHAAVIGHPIAHSRSPQTFAAFAREHDVQLTYDALDIRPADLSAAIAGFRADPDFIGCNVTLPHKENVLALVDEVSPLARMCGAANVITRDGERLIADNTDVPAIVATLRAAGVSLHGACVVIFGAGGAARAVTAAAHDAGCAHLYIAVREPQRAHALAADFAAEVVPLHDVPAADVYINATPVGMSGMPQHSLLPFNAPRGAAAFDLVYTPADTPFLNDAANRGLRTVTGTPMFQTQARLTWNQWFVDKAMPASVMVSLTNHSPNTETMRT